MLGARNGAASVRSWPSVARLTGRGRTAKLEQLPPYRPRKGSLGVRVLFENSTVCSKVSAKFVTTPAHRFRWVVVPLVEHFIALTGVVGVLLG